MRHSAHQVHEGGAVNIDTFHTDCMFAEQDEAFFGPGSKERALCSAPSNGLRFMWPVTETECIQVYVCQKHCARLEALYAERTAEPILGEPAPGEDG
jgi:hypothetical protein